MIVIRHRTGRLAGREQSIEPKSDRVVFGRDPSICDVVFPPDETIVARRHFALVKKLSSEWTFELFGDPFVSVNGEPADVAEAVHSGAVIELGRRGGPSFEIELKGEGLGSTLAQTETQDKVTDPRTAARRARNYALAGLLVAIVAIGGAGAFWYRSSSEAARLSQLVDEANRKQNELAAQSISEPVRKQVLAAAYLVFKKIPGEDARGQGTASPISPTVLATNSHIAEIFMKLKPGEELFVRAPGPNGREYKVIAAKMHPGYTAISDFMSKDPFFYDYDWAAGGLAYDVGTLEVAEGSNLGPILQIAGRTDRNELALLKPGFPLVMAGYPMEHVIGGNVQPLGATPTLATGMVTAVTDPFMLPSDMAHSTVIHHNLPAAGGNSGSPMLGPNGKIFAFLNSGTSFTIKGVRGRIPSGVLKNYAQRADLLLDLLDGKAAALVEADRAYWADRTAAFKRGTDVLVAQVVRSAARTLARYIPDNAPPALVSREKISLSTADRYQEKQRFLENDGSITSKDVTKRRKRVSVKLPNGKPQVFIAYADNTTRVDMILYQGRRELGRDVGDHFFASIPYRYTPAPQQPTDGSAEGIADADLLVMTPDVDVDITIFVYGWGAPPS